MDFTGLSAFPLTPINDSGVDVKPFLNIINRLRDAQVNSIGVLGSTGSYAYLNRSEREYVAKLAIDNSDGVPVMVGVGAVNTRDVHQLTEDAQRARASAVMLAPVSYQKLTDEEVFGLYEEITKFLSIPLCVYDNPGTTNFVFTEELHARIAQLPNIRSIKIPPLTSNLDAGKQRVDSLKSKIPRHVSIGISGDWSGLDGLSVGCDVWYSAIGGLLPKPIMNLVNLAQTQNYVLAQEFADELTPLFDLMKKYGSIRVTATAAEILGIVDYFCLPRPLKSISSDDRIFLKSFLESIDS